MSDTTRSIGWCPDGHGEPVVSLTIRQQQALADIFHAQQYEEPGAWTRKPVIAFSNAHSERLRLCGHERY
jgi:hypothetical protein